MSFVAKYDSTCTRCSDAIEVGQEIRTSSVGRYERYEHVVCPEDCRRDMQHLRAEVGRVRLPLREQS